MEKGLYCKYTIINNETGKELDTPAFVLRPDCDPAAREALMQYAASTDNVELATDISR